MKELKNHNLWSFELSSQESWKVPIWIMVGFQQKDRPNSQNLNNCTFCRLPVVSAQCNIGTEKYPDAGILLNNDDDDDLSQGYSQIKETLGALTKDDILRPCISNDNFRTSNVRADDNGFDLYVFDKRYQKNFTNSQPFKVEIKIDRADPYDINGFALVLTNKLVSVSSDGNRHFDLI